LVIIFRVALARLLQVEEGMITNQSQAIQISDFQDGLSGNGNTPLTVESMITEEDQYRSGVYGLLAGLLRSTPDQAALDRVAGFASVEPSQGELALAMSMLGLAAKTCSPKSIDDEFHDLFIGLGRGELVPYGSWYITGFLMEKPLGKLRDDLAQLGFQRNEDVCEPEDHVAALCEVMLMLIEEGASVELQAHFFNTHMADWIKRFFIDLSEAKAAVFYCGVGRFGAAFIELEERYQAMQV
jgi:TorA maturation chaperone TorD